MQLLMVKTLIKLQIGMLVVEEQVLQVLLLVFQLNMLVVVVEVFKIALPLVFQGLLVLEYSEVVMADKVKIL